MRPLNPRVRTLGAYGAAAAVSIFAALSLLRLWKADLRVPFDYGGDSLFHALLVKSVVDHGWYLNNWNLGAPGGLGLHDFPVADTFHLFAIKVMALFSGDWALLFNAYFLLGFPAITLSAMAVFRQFGVSYGPAIVGAVLYSFLPSRLMKGEAHLFLDVFYQVPLAMLVVLWVCGDDPPLTAGDDGATGRWPRLDLRRRRSLAALAICALTATTSVYYAFFTACLLIAGGIWASIDRRSARNALAGLLLAGAIAAGVAATGLPTIVHQMRHGPNVEVAVRKTGEAEFYGMKIAQLLLPVDRHRVPALGRLKLRYSAGAPLVNENNTASLGAVGSAGFLVLLGVLLLGLRRGRPGQELWRPLALLNIVAVLVATIGGFGSLIALLVTPQIRTYARMNVIIGFLSLFAVVLLLERLQRRHAGLAGKVLPLVLALGLLDQSTNSVVRAYAGTKKAYASDADLVRRIEGAAGRDATIFELPYMTFPEAGSFNHLSDYAPARFYLHSATLRWSYPAMRGREGGVWAAEVSQRPAREMLQGLSLAGVGGLLIDRGGYRDNGSAIEADLRGLLGGEPLVSADGSVAFFDITSFARQALGQLAPEERERRAALELHPLVYGWGSGFFPIENEPGKTFRWCEASGELHIENGGSLRRRVSFAMTAFAAHPPARLTIDGGDLMPGAAIDLAEAGAAFARELDIAPGHHVIRFHSNSRPADAPFDPRTLVWRAENVTFAEQRSN